jgi:hypothetical protein
MPVSIVTSGIARWRVEVDDFIPSRETPMDGAGESRPHIAKDWKASREN